MLEGLFFQCLRVRRKINSKTRAENGQTTLYPAMNLYLDFTQPLQTKKLTSLTVILSLVPSERMVSECILIIQTRDAMREHFVACLKDFGIEATATRRWSRGKVLKGVPISEIHNERKFASSQERAKAHAIARKKERLRAKDKQIQSVISAFKEGRNIEDTPGITKIKKNREKLLQLVSKAVAELEQSGNSEDLKIAAGLKDYYKTLSPVDL